MKPASSCLIVLVTAPDLRTARRLVGLALKARLVACGNLLPRIESHYWWQGKLERSGEVLILFKTVAARLNELEALMLAHHPYQTPEIVAFPIAKGTPAYLRWLAESATGGGATKT